MQPDNAPCLLVIISDIGMRDALVDWLLGYPQKLVFTSTAIDCYGLDPGALNVAEQVTGRQRKLELQIPADIDTARDIYSGLRLAFPNPELHYWIQPVVEADYPGLATKRPAAESD